MVEERLWNEQCKDCPIHMTRRESMGLGMDFERLIDLDTMRRGGYPLEKHDLTPDEWIAMGFLAEERELLLHGFDVK